MSTLKRLLQEKDIKEYIKKNVDPLTGMYLEESPERLRPTIEAFLRRKGYSFQVDYNPIENKVYLAVHYKGEFFDAEVDTELVVMSRLDDIYLECYNNLS